MNDITASGETASELKERLRKTENAAARLARLLAVVVAHADGRVEVPYRHFDELPNNVKLIEHYDETDDCIVLRTGVVEDEKKTKDEPVPQLEEPKPATAVIRAEST